MSSSDLKLMESFQCKLMDDLNLTPKMKKLADGILQFEKKDQPPQLRRIQRSKFDSDVWVFDLFMFPQHYKTAGSLNSRMNKLGKSIFGKENFHCSPKFSNDPLGATGWLSLNYSATTSCRITLPKETLRSSPDFNKYQEYLDELEILYKVEPGYTKKAEVVNAKFKFPITRFNQSYHEEREAISWGACDFDKVWRLVDAK